MRWNLGRLLLTWWIFTPAVIAFGQNPATQTAPIYSVNAKYANGVAPGYAPCGSAAASCPSTSGLNLNLGPGTTNCAGTIISYVGGTLSLTASTTNYVYLDTSSSCAPAVKTSVFTSTDIPIAEVVAGPSVITSITDDRTIFNKPSSGGSGTVINALSNPYANLVADGVTDNCANFNTLEAARPDGSSVYFPMAASKYHFDSTACPNGMVALKAGTYFGDSKGYWNGTTFTNGTLIDAQITTNDIPGVSAHDMADDISASTVYTNCFTSGDAITTGGNNSVWNFGCKARGAAAQGHGVLFQSGPNNFANNLEVHNAWDCLAVRSGYTTFSNIQCTDTFDVIVTSFTGSGNVRNVTGSGIIMNSDTAVTGSGGGVWITSDASGVVTENVHIGGITCFYATNCAWLETSASGSMDNVGFSDVFANITQYGVFDAYDDGTGTIGSATLSNMNGWVVAGNAFENDHQSASIGLLNYQAQYLTGALTFGTFQYVTPTAQWMRQPSPVISPYPTDTSQQVQEPSAILDTSPEILTSLTQVVKMTWTDGWAPPPGGTGICIMFGETPDGITPPTRFGCLTPTIGFARSWLMKNPVGSGYILYATDQATGHVAQFTGSTVEGLTLAHSNVLTCGSNGNEGGATTTGNTAVWYDTTQTHHWRMLYDCVNSTSSPAAYADWLAYSDDGVSWTKAQTAPVIGYGSGVTIGGNCADGGGAWVGILNNIPHAYAHCGPQVVGFSATPTPYIYHFKDSTGVGNAWVPDASPVITARTSNEGVGSNLGQIADAFALDMGSLNQSLLFFSEYTDGCSGASTCTSPSYIEVAAINQPLATIVNETQTDGPSSQSIPTFQVDGIPLNSASVINFVGASQTANGQVSLASGILGASGSPITTADDFVRSPGALGANWTGSANLTITASGLVGDVVAGATTDSDWYTGTTWSSNHCGSVTLGVLPPPDYWLGPTVRETSTAGYSFLAFQGSNVGYIYKYSGGTIEGTSLVGPIALNSSMTVGDVYELCVNGNTLNAYQNGAVISGLTTIDTSFPSGGSPGMVLPAGNVSTRISYFLGTDNSGGGANVTLGGSFIRIGCTAQTPIRLTGATIGMGCSISGSGGVPTDVWVDCAVTSANTVTPRLCTTSATITPAAQQYNVRVIQ